jgi:hypothetical protein
MAKKASPKAARIEQPGAVGHEAESEGRDACAAGQALDANPYGAATSPWSRRAWAEGWRSASRGTECKGSSNR